MSDFLDDYKTRLNFVNWTKRSFKNNDLFITLNCPKIYDMKKFITSKIKSIEHTVYLRRPSNLYRLVMIVTEPQKHIHILMRNVEFKNHRYYSLKDMVEDKFTKVLERRGDVDVREINNVVGVSIYELLKQRECYIETDTLFLPPFN